MFVLGYIVYVLMILVLMFLGMVLLFVVEIGNGCMWDGIDEGIKFSEIYFFGLLFIVVMVGGIILFWFYKWVWFGFLVFDVVLVVCGVVVVVYLIMIYGILMCNFIGILFVLIGILIVVVVGMVLIMELMCWVVGMVFVVIVVVFFGYVFIGDKFLGFLNLFLIIW